MDAGAIARRRMHAQHLWGPPLESPLDVLRRLAAVQSQEFPIARWSVAQRADDVSDEDVDRAFNDGAILRTHVLRPTWHFVLPADIRWLQELTGPRVHALNAYYYRKLELDDALFAKSDALIAEALEGGRQLTRKELSVELDRGGIPATGMRLAYIVMHAELDAIICSGAMRGKQHTYALLDERAPRTEAADRDEALAELTRRYFTAHGPATLKDYMWWSSLTAADGRRGIQLVGSQLANQVVDDRTYWFAASSTDVKAASGRIDLVQGYDAVIVSYGESKDVLAPEAIHGARAVFTHALLVDGRVLGQWRPIRKGSAVVLETAAYRPLRPAEARALQTSAERYGRFLGMPVTLP